MNEKIYIVPGTRREYLDWIDINFDRLYKENNSLTLSNFVCVIDTDQLRGINPIHGLFIGSYKKRPDIEKIVTMINLANGLPYDNRFF